MSNTVLITGCSSGLGREIAWQFHRAGWNVAASMRAPETSSLRDDARLHKLRLDAQDLASIDAAVAATLARFGNIDILINNAGFSMMGVFEEIERERTHEEFAVNLFGLMDVTRAVLPTMRAQRRGVIVNISSASGLYTVPMLSAYHASKFAVEGFSESLSYELASVGITVKLVEPGAMMETSFATRAMAEASRTRAIADYEQFRAGMRAMFSRQGQVSGLASTAEVARITYEAAIDGTPRLRYLAGDDTVPFVRARQQTSEAEYMALMRSTFSV